MVDEIDLVAYKRAFRETPNPSILTGADYVIRDVNKACLEFTGYDREEVIGQTPDLLFTDSSVFFGEVAPALYEGQPWIGSFELKAKDDRFRYGYGTATPLYDGDDVIGYVGVFVDITKRRRAEQTTRILNRVLRHNLRNDANLILGHLELLRDRVDDEGQRSVDIVESRIEKLLERADTARSLEELISSDTPISTEPIRLDTLVADEVEQARERHPDATFELAAVDEVYVDANAALRKAVESVLDNAVQHNDTDTPHVEIRVETDEERQVVLAIADDGPGIPDDEIALLFGLDERSQVRHGQGIDLYFVYELMAEYSGRITVEPNDPRGSVFKFHLRRRAPPSSS